MQGSGRQAGASEPATGASAAQRPRELPSDASVSGDDQRTAAAAPEVPPAAAADLSGLASQEEASSGSPYTEAALLSASEAGQPPQQLEAQAGSALAETPPATRLDATAPRQPDSTFQRQPGSGPDSVPAAAQAQPGGSATATPSARLPDSSWRAGLAPASASRSAGGASAAPKGSLAGKVPAEGGCSCIPPLRVSTCSRACKVPAQRLASIWPLLFCFVFHTVAQHPWCSQTAEAAQQPTLRSWLLLTRTMVHAGSRVQPTPAPLAGSTAAAGATDRASSPAAEPLPAARQPVQLDQAETDAGSLVPGTGTLAAEPLPGSDPLAAPRHDPAAKVQSHMAGCSPPSRALLPASQHTRCSMTPGC